MSHGQKTGDKTLVHQQNKCLNEKRRREQENIYIEELAELISASITDMNTLSVKPDKCAILQETVNQIRRIKEEESGQSEAVQQSQVSSSNSIFANDVLGPLLLEALDGFLFVVNSHGKVIFVSENVVSYLNYSQNDLMEKSIYNIIHVGDHAQFSNSLLPMSLAHSGPTANNFNDNGIQFNAEQLGTKGRTFNCRLLIKPPCEEDGDVEVKQTYVSKYETMQIFAALQQDNSSEGQTCLLCIARREAVKTMLGIEQFTTKQDLNGKIIDCDTRGIAPSHYDYPDFKGHLLQDFCHVNDIQLLAKHLQEVKKNPQATSSVYRFKLLENRYVFVRTQSRFFKSSNSQPDFIVSTHSIIRECDSDAELKGSASTSLMKSIIGPSSNTSGKSNSGGLQGVPSNLHGMLGARNLNMYLPQSLGAPAASSPLPALGVPANIADMLNLNDVFDMLPQSLNFMSNADTLNVSANSVNYTLAGTTSSMTTPSASASSSWSNSTGLKMAVGGNQGHPQQMQRSLSLAQNASVHSQQRSMSANFQRSASLFDTNQKSPGFAGLNLRQGTPSPNFAIPSPRGYGGYMNQKSPGSSSQGELNHGNRGGSQFSPMSYPQSKSTSPLMSPQPGGNWSRPPSSGSMDYHIQSQNPLQALQSMDTNPSSGYTPTQSPIGGARDKQFLFGNRSETHTRRQSVEKKGNQSVKLTQLLTQNNPPMLEKPFSKALEELESAFPIMEESQSKMGLIRHSLWSDSSVENGQQSPQPGPGTSPPEKPQSTSGNDEGEITGKPEPGTKRRDENKILKQLLSQDDDLEDFDKGSNSDQSMDVDKNEAEPKKTNNALLKQLLNDEAQLKDIRNRTANEELHRMLNEEIKRKDNEDLLLDRSMSAPVESTSIEAENLNKVTTTDESSRQRHQSGPQQPTSTTQPGLSVQIKNGSIGTSQISAHQNNTNMFKNLFPDSGPPDSQALFQGKTFQNLMTKLWEQADAPDNNFQPIGQKRKLSVDVDSTDDMDTEPSTSSGPLRNLSKRNVLLAKLLAKKPPQETVVNTNITVNPTAIPQSKIQNTSQSLHKLVHVLDKLDNNPDMGLGNVHNPRDNPRTNPNVPFPGNTTSSTQGHQQQQQQGLGNHERFMPNTSSQDPTSALRQGLANLSNEQLLRCQQELNGRRGISNSSMSGPSSMEVDTSRTITPDPADPFLAQILQQAQELHNDFSAGNINNTVSSSSGGVLVPVENTLGSMMDDTTLLSQLDMVLKDSNFSMTEIDNLLGVNQNSAAYVSSDMSEQMAISAIQKQLMSDSVTSPSPNTMTRPPSTLVTTSMTTQASRMLNPSHTFALLQQQQQQQQQHQQQQQQQQQHQQQQQQQQQQHHTSNSQLSPMDLPFSQTMSTQQATTMTHPPPVPGYSQQGPRLPQPQAQGSALGSVPGRPGFGNMAPNSRAAHVRQTLLLQQKHKQLREQEKRERNRQRQQQQLLLRHQQQQQQQQQAQQFGQFPQRFQQNPMGMDTSSNPAFPENLGELMKSGNAPNVTLQLNQSMPNPMSPRCFTNNQSQQQTLQNMINSGTPPPQLSPHYNQAKAGQWAGSRVNQTAMLPSPTMGQVQGSQFGMRSRHLSGNSMPSPGGTPSGGHFPYPSDPKFNNGQASHAQTGLGMYSQPPTTPQQPSMFNQTRLMQRQLNSTGRGSPRNPHSPYGAGSDPMLMSPHSQSGMSPNPTLRTPSSGQSVSQLSPQFNQNSLPQSYSGQTLNTNYTQSPSVAGSFSPQSVNMADSGYAPSPQGSVNSLTNQPGYQDFDLNSIFGNSGLDSKVSGMIGGDMSLGNTPPSSTSQYVKQEIRNICNARSEKQLQTQQPHGANLDNPGQHGDQLAQSLEFDSTDIPLSILEEIDQIAQQHNMGQQMEPPREDNVLIQSRQEARLRCEQLRQLSHQGTGQHGGMRQVQLYQAPPQPPEETTYKRPGQEEADLKAANLFRNQLLSAPSGSQQTQKGPLEPPHHVNVVQNEPRAPCEEMKPADQKNSLLQQLLSEN